MNIKCFLALAGVLLLPSFGSAQQIKLTFNTDITAPVASEGVVYFGCGDGKLYAVKAADGSTVAGFPVDIAASVGDGVGMNARPSVYYGSLGKAIYLTTAKQGVVKVWPDGTIAWVNKLDGSSVYGGLSTPAVTPDGEVIAEMKTSANIFMVKLKESDGTLLITSPPLSTMAADFVSSPAIVGNSIYTSVGRPLGQRGIIVLNLSDLTVKASVVGGALGWSAPYVRGDGVFLAGGGQPAPIYKLNSATLALDPRFGPAEHPGRIGVGPSDFGVGAEIGASPASADRDPGGTIYASIQNNLFAQVVRFDAVTGSVRGLYHGTYGAGGMCVSSRNVAAYGDGNTMNLFSVTLGGMRSYTVAGRPQRPTYDASTDRFFARTIMGTGGVSYLMGFDSP